MSAGNALLTCADCGEFFRESECGEHVEAVRSEHFGRVAITRGFTKTCPHCASEEIGEPDIEDVYSELRSVTASLRKAESDLAFSQTQAGAFQSEARYLQQQLNAARSVA